MNRGDIPRWVAEQRTAAQIQAQRWQGVDPSRLLEALDVIESLLERSSDTTTASGVSLLIMRATALQHWGMWMNLSHTIEIVAIPSHTTVDLQMATIRDAHDLVGHEARIIPIRRIPGT